MKFSVLTLFPDQVKRFLGESILGRAEEKGILEINAVNIRDFSGNRRKQIDFASSGPYNDRINSIRTRGAQTHRRQLWDLTADFPRRNSPSGAR